VTLADELGAALARPVRRLRRVGGGMLNEAYAAELADGARIFVKAHPDPLPGTFEAEAAGLRWLAEAPGGPPVPEVLGVAEGWLALGWVEPGALTADMQAGLGRALAALHAAGALGFGATAAGTPGAPGHEAPPLRIGPLLLSNEPAADWPGFFAERRLGPLAAMARDRGALRAEGSALVERVCARIGALAGPSEPPARLHGDLWSGNVLAATSGGAHLVDPAAHGGHREVDLAMLRLFGGASERCFAAYAEVAPLADGHAERVGLWQLFPLLVHAVLFGGSYGAQVERAAARLV
jgi:fructosamine-3-kinase